MTSCRVFFRDSRGVEHSVRVEAVNRFHAFGLAIRELEGCSRSNADRSGMETLIVQILDGPSARRRITVTREQFEAWLGTPPPRSGDRLRAYLMMLLGRMEPDREFKKAMSAR